jgi:hypothetical protein
MFVNKEVNPYSLSTKDAVTEVPFPFVVLLSGRLADIIAMPAVVKSSVEQ